MKTIPFLLLCTCSIVFFACADKEGLRKQVNTATKGIIHISVDESFKPVMDAQINFYQAEWPETKIIPHYKSEADCFKDFFNDSLTSLIITTRTLNTDEHKFFADSFKYREQYDKLAYDAVAVVVNQQSPDTAYTMEYLVKLLSGKAEKNKVAVFDGSNATGTVRFAIDSILKGQNFDATTVRSVKNSQEVLNYVAQNPNAVGFVGFSWIGNPEISEQVEMLKKVRLISLPCKKCDGRAYVQPSQYSIAAKEYPLVRSLYYILKDNYEGLGRGFTAFMQYERGQLIFKRAYLGTAMGLAVRNVVLDSAAKKQ